MTTRSPTLGRPTYRPTQSPTVSQGGGGAAGAAGAGGAGAGGAGAGAGGAGAGAGAGGGQEGVSSTGGGASSSKSKGMDNGTVAGVVVGCVLLVALILGLFFCSKQTSDKGDKLGAAELLRAMYTSKMAAEGAHQQAARPSAQFDHHQVYDRRSVAGAAPFIPYVTSGSAGSVSSGMRSQHSGGGAPRPSVQMQPVRPSVHSRRPM